MNGNPFDLGSVWKIFSSWHTAHYRVPSAKYQPFLRELTSMGSASSSQLQCLIAGYCSITFCSIGPLTNLAASLIQTPEVKHGIKEVVITGGAYLKRGNSDPLQLSRRLKDRPLILLGRIISASVRKSQWGQVKYRYLVFRSLCVRMAERYRLISLIPGRRSEFEGLDPRRPFLNWSKGSKRKS